MVSVREYACISYYVTHVSFHLHQNLICYATFNFIRICVQNERYVENISLFLNSILFIFIGQLDLTFSYFVGLACTSVCLNFSGRFLSMIEFKCIYILFFIPLPFYKTRLPV